MNILSWIIYVPLQILFLPFVILGVVLVGYKQIVVSKKLGLSMTAIEVINGRWTMHVFGMRKDEATASLAAALPNTSLFGLWLTLLPLWVKYKISGGVALYPRVPALGAEAIVDLIVERTLYFDRVIERVVEQVDQLVVMGAGYDMGAYGKLQGKNLSFFELDQPSVQTHKLATLESSGIASEHVTFVSVDFTNENAMGRLIESGFDTSKKTLFLWEGVTLYLSEADVRKTMRGICNTATAGSVLLADIYAQRFIEIAGKTSAKKTLDATDEGLDFGLNFSTKHEESLSVFVESGSMPVGECFFLGEKSDKGPFVVVVEVIID